ncbi:MAG: hypothetical protein NVS1B6_06340 [Steroidobacteraceae bacterium]
MHDDFIRFLPAFGAETPKQKILEMQTYQQHLVSERDDLQSKADRLAAFLDTEIYQSLPEAEQDRMRRQLGHMNSYREVLDERIAAFA